MKPSVNCVNLVKSFEGFFPNQYLCPANVKTKGYGSTGKDIYLDDPTTPNDSWSEEFASQLLLDRLTNTYAEEVTTVLKSVGITPTQNQYDALVSFTYNCGVSALVKSTFLKEWVKEYRLPLEHRNLGRVAEYLKRFNKGGGKVLRGLVRRRDAEVALFLK